MSRHRLPPDGLQDLGRAETRRRAMTREERLAAARRMLARLERTWLHWAEHGVTGGLNLHMRRGVSQHGEISATTGEREGYVVPRLAPGTTDDG